MENNTGVVRHAESVGVNERPKERRVWVGIAQKSEYDVFLNENRFGLKLGLDGYDLSEISGRESLLTLFQEKRPGLEPSTVNGYSNWWENFLMKVQIGDYILMPSLDQSIVTFGTVESGLSYERDRAVTNSRNVTWHRPHIAVSDLEGFPFQARQNLAERIWEPGSSLAESFLRVKSELVDVEFNSSVFSISRYAEIDRWVPFHLEVGRRLIEEEMWKPEMRDVFSNFVSQVMGAAGVFDSVGVDPWTPDPFSFYLAFNTASQDRDRDAGYVRVQDILQVTVDPPERGHFARQYPVHYWGEMRPQESGIEILWEFFRFVFSADPLNDEDDASEFVNRFDKLDSSLVPGIASATISHWLYWIDPTKYVMPRRLYWRELGLAGHLGLAEPIEGGAQYLAALKAVNEFAKTRGMTVLDINRGSTTRDMLGLDRIGDGNHAYGIDDVIKDEVFLERDEVERMIRILRSKKNLILQGPPGVGKTFIARKLAYVLMGEKGEEAEKRITSVQFHQSYSYEDFVGGFRPDVVDGQMVFTRQDGPFLKMCTEAQANPDDDYVMLIDEINRGNLSRVFGELLMLIEADKRKPEFGVELQHRSDDEEGLFVPENVYIIGTMNLADRSLTGMNVAMRRRFGFVDLVPQFGKPVFENWLRDETEMPPDMRTRINTRMTALNSTISDDASLGFNYAVGHSFFCPPEGGPVSGWEEWYKTVVDYEIRPLLREYWFDAPDKANKQADTLLGAHES